jgi:hypothetical protein
VVAAGLGSAALLAAIVQTPGLSHVFGCRPLGPWGWTVALSSAAGATAASVVAPELIDRLPSGWLHRVGLAAPAPGPAAAGPLALTAA